jgi:hypothetical protein
LLFVEYLKLSGVDGLTRWWLTAPLVYTSGNTPAVRDVIGTAVLGILTRHWRYAHLTALRGDSVSPALLGMSRVTEDVVWAKLAAMAEGARIATQRLF